MKTPGTAPRPEHEDPLMPDERRSLMAAERPRRGLALPLLSAFGPAATEARTHPAELTGARASPARARRVLPLLDADAEGASYRPWVAVWELTLQCDLACRHCGSRAGHPRSDELSTRECLDVIRQLQSLGTREVSLIGGEAYLRDDWLEIISAIRAAGIRPTMATGGRGLSLERARGAKAAGLASASLSIDGESATHDRLRGVAGAHKAAFDAMANLRQVGIPFGTNSQINRLSMPELPAILARIAAAGAKSWQVQLTVPMGRAADEPDVLLQPYDLLNLFPLLHRLADEARALGVELVAGNNVGYFGPHESALRGRTQAGHSCGCGAGRASLGIEADGTIKGCPSLPTDAWSAGNIRDVALSQLWARAPAMRFTRKRDVADLWGFCSTCYYAADCHAGCTWTSHAFFGRPGNNPYCHHRALEHARRGLRERVVLVEAAPGLPFDYGRFEIVVEPLPASPEN